MSLSGIFSSPSQRRRFLFATGLLIVTCIAIAFSVAAFAPNTPIWNCFNNLFISIVASAAFAVIATLYITYFFVDPTENDTKTTLLPQDVGQALKDIALSATIYRIFVRTGRHFRAEILPILVDQARMLRRPVKIDVVLLDCNDEKICEKYAQFRKHSSFDSKAWDKVAVQTEILSTILALLDAADRSRSFVEIRLFLSKRLSAFRIEGSEHKILITREDPKDMASQYLSNHLDFGAYVTEFTWISEEAAPISIGNPEKILTVSEIFASNTSLLSLEANAKELVNAASPYAR